MVKFYDSFCRCIFITNEEHDPTYTITYKGRHINALCQLLIPVNQRIAKVKQQAINNGGQIPPWQFVHHLSADCFRIYKISRRYYRKNAS